MTKPRYENAPIVKLIENILSHYKCSSNCSAYCCKIQNIEISPHERKIIRKVSKEKTDNLEKIDYNGEKFYRLEPPCPFLSEFNKCSVYDRRPTICRIYPFNLQDDNLRRIRIYPCYLGADISKDFFRYREKRKNEKIHPKHYNNIDEDCILFYRKGEEDIDIPLLGIAPEDLQEFSKYLDENY